MARIFYEPWTPKADALAVIDQATAIARDYRSQGFDLTLRQMYYIEEYDPPPNPAKLTDSRVGGYLDAYGDESWELDAQYVADNWGRISDEYDRETGS